MNHLFSRLGACLNRPFVIASVYAIVSWIWISVSDTFLHQAPLSHRVEGIIDITKGLVFVAVTAVLIYSLLRIAARELTHANRAEQARTESEQRFRVLADSAPVLVWMSDVDAKCDYLNKQCLTFTGRILEQELGMGWTEGIHPEDVQHYLDAYRDAFSAHRALTVEYRLRRHDGQYRWILNNGVPRFTESGTFTGYIGSCVDISDQKEAAGALSSANVMLLSRTEEATARLAAIVEGSDDAIIGYTLDGIITDWNQSATRLYGYSVEEAIGNNLSIIVPPSRKHELTETLDAIAAGERVQQFETVRRRKDGTLIDVSFSASPILGQDGTTIGSSSIVHDITSRKRMEEALRRSEERFQLVARATKDVVLDLDIGSGKVWRSETFWEHFGYPSGDTESGVEDWKDMLHPEDRDRVLNGFQTALARHSDSYEVEYRLRRADGTYAVVLNRTYLVYGETGQPTRAIGAITDLSDRRELEEQFRHAQKMEAVGRLAGGVAHDFNNILQVITTYTEIMKAQLNPEDRLHNSLDQVFKAAGRGADLTNQLLAFSRRQLLSPRIIDLTVVVEDGLKMIRRLIGEDIELNVSLDKALWAVKADPGQIVQVLTNLCVNARDAMDHGGVLAIRTENVSIDVEAARMRSALVPGNYAVLVVSDTGMGMTKEIKARLFEPFFTTKELGKGTGLGLSTVFGIVKQSGGYVWVDSELSHGSTFTVFLPAIDAPLTPTIAPTIKDSEGHGEVILLVEDEEVLRKPISEYLALHGYKVLDAPNGTQAVQIASQHGASIDVLITDMVMPKMGGAEIAQEVAKRSPQVVTLYMSGYTEREFSDYDLGTSRAGFLQKPFAPQTLLQKLRELIARRE